MDAPLRVVSSMATRQVLSELLASRGERDIPGVALESVGGVDAAKRVRAGDAFDVVVLASDAIDALMAEGLLVHGTRVDLVRSVVAVAVRAGAPRPDLGSEAAVRRAVLAVRRVGYSTGPSGVHLAKLFERWGVTQSGATRIVQAPPGRPVAAMVAEGEVDLGFQQLAELINVAGVDVAGPLPEPIQLVTTFAGAVAAASARREASRALLAFLAAPAAAAAKRRHGMAPA